MAPSASCLSHVVLRAGGEWFFFFGVPYCVIKYPRTSSVAVIVGAILVATKAWWRHRLVWDWRRNLTPQSQASEKQQVIEDFAKAIARNEGDGCGILLADGPAARFEVAVGRLSGWSLQDANLDTRFEVASITKTMVSYAVLKLCSRGSLGLDSAIRDFVALDGLGDVTVRQLLTHTSGLPDFWHDGPEYLLKDLVSGLDSPPLITRPLSRIWSYIAVALLGGVVKLNTFISKSIAEPLIFRAGGERIWNPWDVLRIALKNYDFSVLGNFHYADTNYLLLGILLEEIHQKPLYEVLAQEVFEPHGMVDTYVRFDYRSQTDFGAEDKLLSTRYCSEGFLGRFAWTFPDYSLPPLPILTVPIRYCSADWASGGVVTSARDLCRFMRACINDQQYWQTVMASVSNPRCAGVHQYGFGMEVVDIGKHGRLLGHTGDGGACLYYWPEQDVVFAGTTNSQVVHSGTFVKYIIEREHILPCLCAGIKSGRKS